MSQDIVENKVNKFQKKNKKKISKKNKKKLKTRCLQNKKYKIDKIIKKIYYKK